MKPIIGIVGRPNFPDEKDSNIVVKESYRKAIITNGGIPFLILPPKLINYNNATPSENQDLTNEEKEILIKQLEKCDGILIPGGYKVFSHDFFILDYVIKNNIPTLGICLGMQTMSNYKQEYWNEKNTTNHFDMSGNYLHKVNIDRESQLYKIIEQEQIMVNSIHNYHAIKSGIYVICGKSEDNLIEALELPGQKFNIGVQWHPELLNDEPSQKLFKEFIDSSKK